MAEDLEKFPRDFGDSDESENYFQKPQSVKDQDLISNDIDLAYEDPEQELRLAQIGTHPEKIDTHDVNADDKWQYPLDTESGYRIVDWVDGDPQNPMNWSKGRKWLQTMSLGLVCFMVAFSSAVVTGDIDGPMATFHVGMEVIILTVTLFVIGFGIGPLVFAPFSEEWGRQVIYNSTLLIAAIFIIPCAVAKNIGTLLVARFIGGVAFSAPLTLIGGSLSDIWKTEERGVAMAVFSAAPFLGPVVGPLVGGFVGDYAGWRWMYWVLFIFAAVVYVYQALVLPETHHGTLLKRRAAKLRKLTGDARYMTRHEITKAPLLETMKVTLTRPFLLFTELIVFLMSLYMTVIYCLLYIFFFAYPVVFKVDKGWSNHKVGLAFIPIAVGTLLGGFMAPFVNRDYNRRAQKYLDRGEFPPAELRLLPMMVFCWFIPVGLFIFGWTAYPSLSWVGPVLAGFPCGIGFLLVYNSANNYIVDSYRHYAASALAAKTCVRSFGGATVILGTIQQFEKMGNQWAASLLGFVSLACCAIPFMFYIYGARIRAKSKYAYTPEN